MAAPRPNDAALAAGQPLAVPIQDTQEFQARTGRDITLSFPSSVQILDLDSGNPIISHEGQVFSCTWSDMVGTNLFFTDPAITTDAQPLRSTSNYDLIGTSRIKLVGHRAKMTKKKSSASQIGTTDSVFNEQAAASHVAPEEHVRESRAAFLEKVMNIKQRHGGTNS